MSATLAKQFQDYAARCLELARAARTTAGRARFMQMAREYQSAASLIHTELSADGGADRGGRGAEQWRAPKIICKARGLTRMPLSPEQEALCERVEKGEPEPGAAALIRQQAQEIDALWDRLSHAYALVRRESPAEMIQEEMEALRAMLDERRRSQLKKS